MDFKWFGNHKAHHKSHSSDLPPSASFLRRGLASGLLRWPGSKWCQMVARVSSWARGSHRPRPERPSRSAGLGRLILLPPQTGPWQVSRAGGFLIDKQGSMEKQFLWFTQGNTALALDTRAKMNVTKIN